MNGSETFITAESIFEDNSNTTKIEILKIWNLNSSAPIKTYTIAKGASGGVFELA